MSGNLTGALIAFVYFTFVDVDAVGKVDLGGEILYFVVVFTALAAAGIWWGRGWLRPLWAASDGVDRLARQRVLMVPYAMAGIALVGWGVAGGVVRPWLLGRFSMIASARTVFGVAGIAGTVTTAFVFLVAEQLSRRALPAFFPGGDLGDVAGVVRMRVRTRLLAAFVLSAVVPLLVMGALSSTRAAAILGADPAAAARLLDNLRLAAAFLTVAGTVTALGLATFVARSVAGPLRELEAAMRRVEAGDLATHCAVVSTDEIGAVSAGFNRMVEGLRERERIRETFGKYVTREIRDEILAGRVALDGEAMDVTILFSDLRDFTPWVEAHDPAVVLRDLNAYFSRMEGAIRIHHGLVLQFIGDEIEAVFGAPLRRPEHADLALAAALEMRRRLAALNAERAAAGQPALRHGVGIHTGRVLAGNIGSPDRLSYALVGDPVNVASRIQDATKQAGTDILISGSTRRHLTSPAPARRLPAVRVKGKTAEVEVYAVD